MENTKREIKFRAWNVEKKRMSYQDGTGSQPLILRIDGALALLDKKSNEKYQYEYRDNLFITDEEGGKYHPEDFVLMQYTGLKDKNGKEIYEGDILANKEVHGDNFYCVVEYGIGGFNGVTYPGRNHSMPLHTIMTCAGAEYNEIIGNVYENANLLSSTNER